MPVTWVRGVLFFCLCTKSGRLQKVERAQSVPTARHQHRNGCTHHRPHWDATFFLSILEWLRAQTQSCSTWTTLRGDIGIRETRFTNMSAGVSILVNKRSWKARHVVMIFDAPSKLQGRTGAIRRQCWQEGITAIVVYWPPKRQEASSRAACAETLYGLAGWPRKTFQDTPKRSTPCIMTDVSDWMGEPRNDDENMAVTGDILLERRDQRPLCSGTPCRKKGWQ